MMKTRWICFAVCSLLMAIPAEIWAQAATPVTADMLRVRRLEAKLVAAPQYQVSQSVRTVRQRQWLEVRTQFETAPDWIDEMTFTYYVLLRNTKPRPNEQEYNLFKGEVTYVNIAKTRTGQDTVFLHPSTIERYGSVDRVGLVITSQGRVLAMESNPSSQERWWERATPRTGLVLNRMQTPFAMINFDDYEAIKQPDR